MAKKHKLQIVYHGTDEATAQKILKHGFKRGTFFATHLKHALGYGGKYIFAVPFESNRIPKVPDWEFEGGEKPKGKPGSQYWEFVTDEPIPPSMIANLKHYPDGTTIAKSKGPRLEFAKGLSVSHITMPSTKAQRSKTIPGVGYFDKGNQRLSRRHHRGFRRVKLA